jgi:hypothetical protein
VRRAARRTTGWIPVHGSSTRHRLRVERAGAEGDGRGDDEGIEDVSAHVPRSFSAAGLRGKARSARASSARIGGAANADRHAIGGRQAIVNSVVARRECVGRGSKTTDGGNRDVPGFHMMCRIARQSARRVATTVFGLDTLTGERIASPSMSEYRSALRNPWWIPVFLGGVPDVEPRLISLLGLVSLALFFEQYDISMLTSALKFIATDLGMTERDLGGFLALIRLGALPAFLIMPLADRIGRRRVFLISVLAFSVGTLVTAFARTATEFIIAQIAARTFMLSGSAVAFVIITEEYPARYRGWAIGMLGALAACGNGLGAGLFAAIDHLPYGWRSLYAIGIVPLALLPLLRRQVSETRRFDRHRASAAGRAAPAWYRPMLDLASAYPGRALGVGIAGG